MDIKKIITAGLYALLFFSCRKKSIECSKAGDEYVYAASFCWYIPTKDSIPLGDSLFLFASVPKRFIDENSNLNVSNTSSIIEGPLHIIRLYPTNQYAADDFKMSAEIGKVIKDTANFSEGALKGFRTIQWDGSPPDSFKIKIKIKPLVKGVYSLALGQQGYKDSDCALYKYFLKVGNTDQHLNYWMDVFGNVSEEVAFFSYCFKVY